MKKDKFSIKLLSNIVLFLFSLCCIIPLIIVISISFSDENIIKQSGYGVLPKGFSTEAYAMLFESPKTIFNAYGITIFITIVGTLLTLFLACTFAYVICRRSFVLRKQYTFILFFTMLFSGGVVPLYILVTKYLGLKDSLWAIILPLAVNPWNTMLLKSFFSSVPETLIEAAKIEGCSEFYIFSKIFLPICKGGIATVTIFVLLGYWNEWYYNMLFIMDVDKYSLQYMLTSIMNKLEFLQLSDNMGMIATSELPKETLRMATCIVAAGPMILIFPFFQKYLVKGITVGAVKE